MATIQLAPDFKEFLRLMNSRQVKYLVVGGYAVGYHGYPRTTGDLDIWVGVDPANAVRLLDVLKEFGFPAQELSVESLTAENQVIRMGIPPVRIELLTTISGAGFEECYSQRTVDTVDGVSARC